MKLSEFADIAVSVPFVEFGRDYNGWDCWGLVFCGQRDVFGRIMPSYAGEYGSTSRRDELKRLIAMHREERTDWALVEEPRAGDVVLLEMLGRACHIGMMLDHRNVLHTEVRCNTVVERIDREPWRGNGYDKIEGVYRYVG